MKQLTLLGLEPVSSLSADPAPNADGSEPGSAGAVRMSVVDECQAALFEDRAVLLRDIDCTLEQGDFEGALRALRALEGLYGSPAEGPPAACLESLADLSWEIPGKVLDSWTAIEPGLQPGPRRRALRGVFVRLLAAQASEDVVRARPGCLPALASFLPVAPGRPEGEGRREARRLVRDALLAGRTLEPLHFTDDQAVEEVLAEDLPPRWLACLGSIRRLWPAPPLSPSEIDGLGAGRPEALVADDAALAFWHCLRAAEAPECPTEVLHEARRRMKALHPDLHAAFMRRLPPRLGG